MLHEDLRSIVHDIREAHRKDPTTADEGSIPTSEQVQRSVENAAKIGANIQELMSTFGQQMAIPMKSKKPIN